MPRSPPASRASPGSSLVCDRRAQRSRRAAGVERGARGHRAGAAPGGGTDRARASGSARSPTTSSKRPSSGSSSTPSGSCSRSASASPTAGSTPRTTTRWPPRRGSRASWRSPPAQISHEHWFKLGRSLTPSGTLARAAVVERLDVRVPDAAARHARVSRARCSTRPTAPSSSGRSSTARSAACRGASPSPPTTRRISRSNYQYRAFGVPGLGLKRGLGDDLVVAPYATHPRGAARAAGRARAISSACAREGHGRPLRLLRSDRLHARARAAEGTRAAWCCPPTWRTTRA